MKHGLNTDEAGGQKNLRLTALSSGSFEKVAPKSALDLKRGLHDPTGKYPGGEISYRFIRVASVFYPWLSLGRYLRLGPEFEK
jgi:hypothetical protein